MAVAPQFRTATNLLMAIAVVVKTLLVCWKTAVSLDI